MIVAFDYTSSALCLVLRFYCMKSTLEVVASIEPVPLKHV